MSSAQDNSLNNSLKGVNREPEFQRSGSLIYLQTLLYFDQYYTYLLFIGTLALNTFKLYAMPFPQGYWSIEILVLIIYLCISLTRISFGMIGNRIESAKNILGMIMLSIFSVLCNIFFMDRQTYILKVELVLHIVAIVFVGLEVLLGVLVGGFAFKSD